MEEKINPFEKAGKVLVVIGILDILFMVYAISNQMSYSSSFNIFSVIAGIFLIKGGVKTARVVRWFSAFCVIAFTAMYILMPFSTPFELTVTQFKLNPLGMSLSYLIGIVFIIVLAWVYKQLSTEASLAVLKEAGYNTGKPKSAAYISAFLIVLGGIFTGMFLTGESAIKAEELARAEHGSEYKYRISSLSTSGNKGSAVVTAYNSNEIKNVRVSW